MSIPQPIFNSFVPENYDRHLVPVLFIPFANSLSAKVASLGSKKVLELACGTGAVTRALSAALHAEAEIVATDISPAMLEYAQQNHGESHSVMWQVADACTLPFENATFDAVVCQFGAMFFPDKSGAMSEALRVLSPGGHLLFSTWGPIEANPVFQAIEKTLTAMFPEEETPFMPTPFAMCESVPIKVLVEGAGFDAVEILEESHSVGPHDPASIAAGFAFGTPLSVYLSSQGYNLDEVHAALTASFATDLGSPAFFGMQALVCHAERWIELPKSMAAVAKISAVLVLTYLNLRYFPGVAGS